MVESPKPSKARENIQKCSLRYTDLTSARPGKNVYFPASWPKFPSSRADFPLCISLFFPSKSQNFPARSFLFCLLFPGLPSACMGNATHSVVMGKMIQITALKDHCTEKYHLIEKYNRHTIINLQYAVAPKWCRARLPNFVVYPRSTVPDHR